jgi:hypothetical protein
VSLLASKDARKVEYTAKRDSFEAIEWRGDYGLYRRFGQHIVTFRASPAQKRAFQAGRRINITRAMIDRGVPFRDQQLRNSGQ